MSTSSSSSPGGIDLLGLSFLVFLVMKLLGVITWSWWWVTAPLWGGFVVFMFFLIVGFIIGLLLKGSE